MGPYPGIRTVARTEPAEPPAHWSHPPAWLIQAASSLVVTLNVPFKPLKVQSLDRAHGIGAKVTVETGATCPTSPPMRSTQRRPPATPPRLSIGKPLAPGTTSNRPVCPVERLHLQWLK